MIKGVGTATTGALMVMVTGMMQVVTASQSIPAETPDLVGVLLDKGGLTALMAVLIYFYRRDWVRLNDYQKSQNDQQREHNAQLVAVITRSNEVQQAQALANQRQAQAIEDLTVAVRGLEVRRLEAARQEPGRS